MNFSQHFFLQFFLLKKNVFVKVFPMQKKFVHKISFLQKLVYFVLKIQWQIFSGKNVSANFYFLQKFVFANFFDTFSLIEIFDLANF